MSDLSKLNEPKRTMKEMAQEALNVQDACNLSGVVHSFSRTITDLRLLLEKELGTDFSTDKLNRHPVCILFTSKIASLTGYEQGSCLDADYEYGFTKAYNWAKDITNG